MKNCKTFYEAQTVSRLKEIIQPPPTQNFLTEIYRNIQTFAFKVLRECSSWASRNDAVQMFWHQKKKKNVFTGKCLKPFGYVAGAYYFQCQVS